MEQHQETLTDLNQAIEQHPDNPRTLAHRGETYYLMGCYEEALADFDRAIELKPDYAWAIAHRGETCYYLERYEDALANFNWALDLEPDYVWGLAHRGVTYYRLQRLEAALTDLNRAIELKPDYAWAIHCRANVYVALKCYEQALADADRTNDLDKTFVAHWAGERGMLLNYLGRYSETIADCQPALQEDPNDYFALYSLTVAVALSKGGAQAQTKIKMAQSVLQSLINIDEPGLIVYRLGGLAALEGEVKQALNYLQEAVSLHHEPIETARHDPAWVDLHTDPRFQTLILEKEVIAG